MAGASNRSILWTAITAVPAHHRASVMGRLNQACEWRGFVSRALTALAVAAIVSAMVLGTPALR